MRYEKKMLILSGAGKGVVLIEKSALGVKFALRTFSLPAVAGLKAGVVTRSCVVVRELPACADPSLVFYIDDSAIDLNYLHFAVFDGALRLYGATAERMWESNLMDLLIKADRVTAPPPLLSQSLELKPFPASPVRPSLPDADGSGNPQLRAVYGDDLIAGENYYTPFDIAARMKEVDGFLDAPRVLDGIAPRIKKADALDPPSVAAENMRHDDLIEEERATDASENIENNILHDTKTTVTESTEPETADAEKAEVGLFEPNGDGAMQEAAATDTDDAEEVAATVAPWERAAQYLNALSSDGELVLRRESVVAVKPKTQVKRVREANFFERCRADVDKLFSSAAKDGELNAILPDIDWVKVPFDGHTVSVGRGGDVFLCYAVPGVYEKVSPLGDEAQWLPKHKNAPTGRGYWLIFQDLKSGYIINAS